MRLTPAPAWSVQHVVERFEALLSHKVRMSGIAWVKSVRGPRVAFFRLGQDKVVSGWSNVRSSLLMITPKQEGTAKGSKTSFDETQKAVGKGSRGKRLSRASSSGSKKSMQKIVVDPLSLGPGPTGIRRILNPKLKISGATSMEISHWKASRQLKECWQEPLSTDAGQMGPQAPELHAREALAGLYWGSVAMSHDLRYAKLDLWMKVRPQ